MPLNFSRISSHLNPLGYYCDTSYLDVLSLWSFGFWVPLIGNRWRMAFSQIVTRVSTTERSWRRWTRRHLSQTMVHTNRPFMQGISDKYCMRANVINWQRNEASSFTCSDIWYLVLFPSGENSTSLRTLQVTGEFQFLNPLLRFCKWRFSCLSFT